MPRIQRKTLMANLESYIGRKTTMEMIGFQMADRFGPDMQAICTRFKDLVDQGLSANKIDESDLKKEFTDLIYKRFGLSVTLKTNSHVASVIPNIYTSDNIVINDYLREYAKTQNPKFLPGARSIISSGNGVKGYIDSKNVKVSGWFSQQVSPIFINFTELYKDGGQTPAEATAIVLHEIGHIFNAVLYLDRTNTTNQIIADVAKHINDKTKPTDVEYIYKEIKKLNPEDAMDIAQGLASGEATIMGACAYRLMVGTTQSLMMDKTYDRVSFEALSDNFAARFGYGEHFVVGFEKFEKQFSEEEMEQYRGSSLNTMFGLSIAATIFFTVITLVPGFLILRVITAFYALFFGFLLKRCFSVTGSEGKFRIYDSVKLRYVRIRNQLVEYIKNPDIESAIRRNILSQIETIDVIIKDKVTYQYFVDNMVDHVFPKDRRAKHSIEEQQRIETMISNDIFVQANRLKLLAG